MSPARQEETAAPEAPLQRSRCARVCIGFALVAALAAHAGLLAWGAWQHSPTVDEVGHLAAGVNLWRTGSFDWYRVNPPLVRAVAAIPVVILRPGVGPLPSDATRPRAEFTGGVWFAEQNGADSARLFSLARWASIPWSLLGACVCFQWARALYGDVAGVLALILWCFCPNVLGHGQLITPDVGASALGAGACFLYWRWLRAADWPNAILAGFGLGLAELAKFTWILLFLVWPVLWLVWRFSRGTTGRARNGRREALQVAAIMLLGVFIINTGYGFEGSFKKLDDYDFVSRAFRGAAIAKEDSDAVGNRFRGTWLGTIPVPVPANYLSGMDVQKDDFEQGMWSYLRGKWRFGGWWYYYLYALAVKVPLGTWSLATLAFLTPVLLRGYSASWRDELVLLRPRLPFSET